MSPGTDGGKPVLVYSEALTGYDFGKDHAMSPGRVRHAVELARSLGVLEHLERVREILAATGRVAVVPEHYLDAVTAISGSGPAYLFFVVEAMIEAGVHLGLPRDTSTELVVQTMLGSAKLLRESGEHPAILRERVTSPGGTTAAALRELEDHKVRAAFLSAMEAARARSRSLAAAAREQQAGA